MGAGSEASRRERPPRWLLEEVPLDSRNGALAVATLIVALLFVAAPAAFRLAIWISTGTPLGPATELNITWLWVTLAAEFVVFGLAPVAYLRLARPSRQVWQELRLGISERTILHVVLGVAVAFAGIGFVYVATDFVQYYFGLEEGASALGESLAEMIREHSELLLIIPLLAGFAEEVFFRGLLQPRIGLLASNALFALAHVGYSTVIQVVATFLLGFLFGWLYHTTRSLWAPIAAHIGYDLIRALALFYSDA